MLFILHEIAAVQLAKPLLKVTKLSNKIALRSTLSDKFKTRISAETRIPSFFFCDTISHSIELDVGFHDQQRKKKLFIQVKHISI